MLRTWVAPPTPAAVLCNAKYTLLLRLQVKRRPEGRKEKKHTHTHFHLQGKFFGTMLSVPFKKTDASIDLAGPLRRYLMKEFSKVCQGVFCSGAC